MNTWTFKGLMLSLLALAGCDLGSGGAGVQRADLSQGAITLVAPSGYCIDRRSLRARFALMARCDTLGAGSAGAVPLAVITATAVAAEALVSEENLSGADETILARDTRDDVTLIQVRGTPPNPDLRDVFWRGAGRVGDQVVGLALYEGKDSAALGPQAPDILAQTLRRTRQNSRTPTDNSATPLDNRGLGPLLSGLFE